MMNILKTTTLIAFTLTSTVVFATPSTGDNSVDWVGSTDSDEFDVGCSFTKQEDGTMTLSGTTWTVTTPASIKVKVREANSIDVDTDGVLRSSAGPDVDSTVDYAGSTATANGGINTSITRSDNNMDIRIDPYTGSKFVTIDIDGDATVDSTDDLVNGATYKITHTVTCTQ